MTSRSTRSWRSSSGLHAFMHSNHGALMQDIVKTGNWDDKIEATFKAALDEFKKTGSW